MNEIIGKVLMVPFALNIKGEGPETDVDKIAVILYQVWDEANVTHFEFYNEKDALDKVAELNEERN